jgi:pyruvate dehydrogenase complex dehydrogenase (E1) component
VGAERYVSLGADGFGFSDTRAAARRFFKIDGPSIVVRALQALADEGSSTGRSRRRRSRSTACTT